MADFKIISGSGGGSGYTTIEENGSSLPQEHILNFVGSNVSIVDNPGNGSTDVTITSTGGFTWVEATTSTTMSVNNGYNATSASLVSLALPSMAAFGSVISVSAFGTGGFTITQAAGQTIHFGDKSSTTGTSGSISSTNLYDTITIFCSAVNTDFTVTSAIGNLTIV